MQRLTNVRRWLSGDAPIPDEATRKRIELRWGIVAMICVLILIVTAGLIYTLPLGKRTYYAQLAEAGSIKTGEDVRIAGIPVGEVTSLTLRRGHVDMSFTIDSDVRVGDQSTLDIRMLTVVGGHYIALTPAGTGELGSTPIPVVRVRLPYNLMRAFQDAEAPIRAVDGNTLRANFAALQDSLSSSPDGLRRAGAAVDSLVEVLHTQNEDVSRTLALADEYLSAIDTSKTLLGGLIGKINQLENLLIDKRAEIVEAVTITGNVITRIANLDTAWNTIEPMAQELAATLPELQRLGDNLAGVIESVRRTGEQLQQHISPEGGFVVDQSASIVQAPTVCIPVPGRGC